MEIIEKNNFIELEYTGRVRDGAIFDTNIKEEAEKINLNIETSPVIICLGQSMILKAIDDFLMGQKIGKYTLELAPEKAFGTRQSFLIKTIPTNVFRNQNITPQPGMVFSFDNMLGKISAVSGGRVIVDFNNPLAGKIVIYELNVKRKVENINEKVDCLSLFFFKRKIDFALDGNKLILKPEKNLTKFVNLFSEKFREILSLELEVKEDSEKPGQDSEKSQ